MLGWTVIGVVLLRVVWYSVAAIYQASTEVSGKPAPTESITLLLIAQIIAAALLRRRHELALRASLDKIERLNQQLRAENLYLNEEIKNTGGFDEIVGKSEVLRMALGRVEHVAPTDSTVLLLGESGTGKELFARAIHDRSSRRKRWHALPGRSGRPCARPAEPAAARAAEW